ATGRLHVDHRALDHALEARSRLGVGGAVGHQGFEFGLEIIDETGAQLVEIDAAGSHHRRRIRVIDERQQKMFKRRVLMMTLVCNRQRTVQGLFKALRKSRHSRPLWPPVIMIAITQSGNNNLRHPPSYSYARSWRKTGSVNSGFPLNLHATATPEPIPEKLPGSPSASVSLKQCKTRSFWAGYLPDPGSHAAT